MGGDDRHVRLYMRQWILWLTATVGVPLAFAAFVYGQYQIALRYGALPQDTFPAWLWISGYGAALVGGVVAVFLTSLRPTWLRVIVGLVYLAAMALGLLVVHFLMACASGDCL